MSKVFGFTRKILDDFTVVSGMCLFQEENHQPILGSLRFLDESHVFLLDESKRTQFTDEN